MSQVKRFAVFIIRGRIEAVTGLRIGGSANNFSIGGNDNPVIRDPLTQQPYIPGSSLRGKMRSLLEKYYGLPLVKLGSVRLHLVKNAADYEKSPVANIFGVSANDQFGLPTRLLVRDVRLTAEAVQLLNAARTDAPFTEIKSEVAIDRITSQANPRTMERVPAGASFGPMELVYSVYQRRDVDEFLPVLLKGLELLEEDYLGGGGARGNGKVRFADLEVRRRVSQTEQGEAVEQFANLGALLVDQQRLIQGAVELVRQHYPDF